MEILFHSILEEGVELSYWQFHFTITWSRHVFLNFFSNVDFFFLQKQVGNFSGVQKIVYVFNKRFLFNLGVCEEENSLIIVSSWTP